jgi:hypothetical protein
VESKEIKFSLLKDKWIPRSVRPNFSVSGALITNFNRLVLVDLTAPCAGNEGGAGLLSLQLVPTSGDHFLYINFPELRQAQPVDATRQIVIAIEIGALPQEDLELRLYQGDQLFAQAALAVPLYYVEREAEGRALAEGMQKSRCKLIVSGQAKSGTTWMQQILNGHPDLLVLHEGALFQRATRALRTVQGRALFRDVMVSNTWSLWPHGLNLTDELFDYLDICFASETFTHIQHWWRGPLADRTPGCSRIYVKALEALQELKIIHVVRNPLDVLVSSVFHELNLDRMGIFSSDGRESWSQRVISYDVLMKVKARLEASIQTVGALGADADFLRGDFDRILEEWRRDQHDASAANNAFPDRVMIVHYEDLLKDFHNVAGQCFEFIGLTVDDALMDRIAKDVSFETLSGGRMNGQRDMNSFFRYGTSGDYINFLTPNQISYCLELLGKAAEKYPIALDHYTGEPSQ